jgi:hypothetical protein
MSMSRSLSALLFVIFILLSESVAAQSVNNGYFREVELHTDTTIYKLSQHQVMIKGEKHLAFQYSSLNQVVEVRLLPVTLPAQAQISLMPSGDYEVVDSLLNVNDEYFRFKVKFTNLAASQLLSFTLKIQEPQAQRASIQEIRLFPYANTYVKLYPESDELYIGEEKVVELITNNLDNVKADNTWTSGFNIDYKISKQNSVLRLHLLPNKLGNHTVKIEPETNSAFLSPHDQVTTLLPAITQTYNVKASRIAFLNLDMKEIILDEEARKKGIEVQLDNSRLLTMQRTYRIENQEEPGGALIAEIFTKNLLSNGKVLCVLRVFNYHRQSEGYLYIKDADAAKFVTNFAILPKPTVHSISILREGADWTQNLGVRPGETIEVRLEGEGLQKSRFQFDGALDITSDTVVRSENLLLYRLKIPVNISKSKIEIYHNSVKTGQALQVREYQVPKNLDFVRLTFGEKAMPVTLLNQPVLYSKTIRDIVISFAPNQIDTEQRLYGKQYLDIEIRITGSRGELVELKTIEGIVVCPDESSPRAAFYEDKQCQRGTINLNNHISRKTYDLEEWSRVQITIKHDKDKYGGEGMQHRVELIVQRSYRFDIDVSFPAGLIVKQVHETGFGDLGGISLAMIAQFSFYHPDKVARLRPYKIGAGFLAFNAFNFSANASNRDVGAVIIGSLYPVRRDAKLTFPLYLGGGYFLSKGKWFFLLGPGIRVSL